MLKDTSLKEDPALAFEAFNANISPEPDHLPLIAAAGMLFLEADHVTQLYLNNHLFCLGGWFYRGRYVLIWSRSEEAAIRAA